MGSEAFLFDTKIISLCRAAVKRGTQKRTRPSVKWTGRPSALEKLEKYRLSQFSKIVPIETAYLRYAVCGCCQGIKNANCYTSNLNYLFSIILKTRKNTSPFLQNFPCCAKKRVPPLPQHRACRHVLFAVRFSGRQRPLHPSFRRYVCKKARFFVRFVSCAQRHFSVQ